MKLIHVDIENFRSVKNSEIYFEKYPCRILIGMNETGKSNILKAIRTLDNSYDITNNAILDKRFPTSDEENFTNSFYVDFCFNLEEHELILIYNKLKKLFCCRDIENTKIFQKGKEQFTLEELVQHLCGIVKRVNLTKKEKHTFLWPKRFEKKEFSIVFSDNWKQIPANVPTIIINEGESIPKNEYIYIKTDEFPVQPRPFTDSIDINAFGILFLKEIETILDTNLPQIIYWENLEDHAFHADINIQNFISDPNTYPHFKSMCLLLNKIFPNADSITQVFQEKQKANQLGILYQQISDKTTDYLRSIWDDFANEKLVIDTSKGNSIIGISVVNNKNYSNPFPTSYRSDGFKKFLKLMLNLSLKVNANEIRDSIILIDEAELYLHPPAAEDFKDELLLLAEKNNNIVIFSTHSPFMIDGNAIERHLIVKKENEITTLKEGEEGKWFEEELLWQALGCGIIRTLPHKTIIFEGWDDKVLFKTGLNIVDEVDKEHIKPGDKSKLAIAHAGGAYHIRNCLPAFQAANSTVIIVCDSDQAGKDEQKFCKDNQLWGCDTFYTYEDLGGKRDETAEDYLTIDRINSAIEQIRKKYKLSTTPDFSGINYRVMPQVKTWIKSENIDDVDSVIVRFKDYLFRGLKQSHVKDSFGIILKKLNENLSRLSKMKS